MTHFLPGARLVLIVALRLGGTPAWAQSDDLPAPDDL